MKYKFIGIDEATVYGIKKAKFIMRGTLNEEKCKFYKKINGDISEVDYSLNKENKFYLEFELDDSDKKIEIILEKNNVKYPIYNGMNTKKTRIKNKVKKIISKIINLPKVLFVKLKSILFKIISLIKRILVVIYKGIRFAWREHHFLIPPILWKKYFKMFINKIRNNNLYHPFDVNQYNKWLNIFEQEAQYEDLEYNPLISILIPVYNINREYLSDCLDSILNQKYQNFEVCLADDCSTLDETLETLKEYQNKDKRIKVIYRKENGHISKATNSALEIAKGEFVALMDNDDILTPNALYEMVYVLNQNKNLDLIYSDEDKVDMEGNRCEPHFKPDYSPDSLFGGNYICHFEILRRSILEEIGGFRSEYVGAQDFDLFLRFIEKTTPDRIYHIPKILYHWRKVPGSTADTIENKDYAIENGRKAVEDALKRRKLKGRVLVPIKCTHYIVEYTYEKEPLVSIIIPTKDLSSTLEDCLKSIYTKTKYKNFEVIVVNNDSIQKETFRLFDKYKKKHSNFKVIDFSGEFNYSKINNIAVEKSNGEYLLFLNNDTEIITPTWINSMVGYAMQEHIGAVGVKLLYDDDTVQHGGVVLGINGPAQHSFLHEPRDSYGFYGRLLVPYNYSAVTAACMMISRKKFDKVKGFNENLKIAFNDVDLNLKLLDEGYYNVFLPQVEVYHYESKSRGLDTTTEKYKIYLAEEKYMFDKWKKYIDNDPFYNPNFSKKSSFMLDKTRKGEKEDEK